MNAEVIAVGSELLLGQIVNSNAKYLSEQLSHLGINVYYHTVVGDNESRLSDVLSIAKERSNLLILTGGLGPTKDDLTKETVGKMLGKQLVHDKETEERICQFFEKRGREMTENNRKQALIIEGSHVFPNDHGLACGMAISSKELQILMLPGPPKELQPMFETYAIPYFQKQMKVKSFIQSRVLRFFDIGESQLVDKIDNLLETQTNPTIAPLASDGEVTLRLTVKGEKEEENTYLLDEVQNKILQKVGSFFVGIGDQTLMGMLVRLLQQTNTTITAAESLTGGLFSAGVTNEPGTSKIFPGGFITYGNDMKSLQLDISDELLQNDGAVSHACAKEMAKKSREKAKTDYGISFTGVAGPDSLEGHPVGTVYIGISSKSKTESYEIKLAGSRQNIRERSVKYGVHFLLQWIRKETEKVDE
ncbi:competence/damage-inducible protein A [Evansella sp. AB-rgal1]|uniref:competence/damage-inducible protein A n=1 Tax=Evansella sp. AB-rgal1 TaxID=3242696 RepID=UPI00359E2916